MHKLLVVLITCGVIAFAKLPHYITKCSVKDPNINTCALNSARQALPHIIKGDRKIRIPVMDPLFILQMRMTSQGLEASVENSTALGLTDTILEKVGFDFNKKESSFQCIVPHLKFIGSYGLSGKVASLAISGKGTFTASLYNVTVQYKAIYDLQKLDDGEVYMIFNDYDCDIVPEHVVSRLENLFNGNKQLGDAMNSFLNENWRLAYNDVGKDLSMAVGQLVFSIFKQSSKTVPYNEIFDDVE